MFIRRFSFLLALAFCLVCTLPAFAAETTPPGFLPGAPVSGVDWQKAEAACKAQGAYLPTAWQLQDIASGKGDGSFSQYGWPAKAFWTRESKPMEMDGKLVRQYYAVSMDRGTMDLFDNERLNAYVCAKGAGMDRKARPIQDVASVIAPVTMPYDDAERYCAARGKKLPSVKALQSIAKGTGNAAFERAYWPQGLFWSSDYGANKPMLVNLGSGEAAAFPPEAPQWAVCGE